MKSFVYGLIAVALAACKTPQPASPAAPASAAAEVASPAARHPLVGYWKIAAFSFISTPPGADPEMFKQFAAKTVIVGEVHFEADGQYSSIVAEGQEKGKWQIDGNTVTIEKESGETDRLTLLTPAGKELKATISSGEHLKAAVTLERILIKD